MRSALSQPISLRERKRGVADISTQVVHELLVHAKGWIKQMITITITVLAPIEARSNLIARSGNF